MFNKQDEIRKKIKEEKKPELEEEIRKSTPQELYNFLGPEDKWREHIDGQHHKHGPKVYLLGLHLPEGERFEDPNYNQEMMAADKYVSETLKDRPPRPLTVGDYCEITRLTFTNPDLTPDDYSRHLDELEKKALAGDEQAQKEFEKGEENPPDFFRVLSQKDRSEYPTLFTFGSDEIPDLTKAQSVVAQSTFLSGIKVINEGDKQYYAFQSKTKEIEDPLAEVGKILGNYYKKRETCKTRDGMMELIVKTHKDLEDLHPFEDHNTRTNRLVLNRMLVENGFPPTILNKPTHIHYLTPEEWQQEIERGQALWLEHVRQVKVQKPEKAIKEIENEKTEELEEMWHTEDQEVKPSPNELDRERVEEEKRKKEKGKEKIDLDLC